MTPNSTRLPNLLLVGVQKSGTTWMHEMLSSSQFIFGSEKKEVNFWGRTNSLDRLEEYRSHFPVTVKPNARYYVESTPHYFHAPNIFVDIAQQIKDGIPNVRPMVILRNPIDRYRSAFTHHMQKGRLEYTPEIDLFTDDQIMLSTGLYGRILAHWRSVFPNIIVLSYDQLKTSPDQLMAEVFSKLGITDDFDLSEPLRPVHTSVQKTKKSGWPTTPQLTQRLRNQLVEYYRHDVDQLQHLVEFDVSHWVAGD